MQTLIEFITDVLDPIGIVVGLLIAIPVVWTWWDIVFGHARRRKRWHREILRQPGTRPGILIVDLLAGKNIEADVENFRQQDNALKAIPNERILTLRRDKHIKPEQLPAIAEELREKANELMAQGVDTLHYFHAGPSVLAALVGAEFANGCRVMLYQHKPGGYENFGPLRTDW